MDFLDDYIFNFLIVHSEFFIYSVIFLLLFLGGLGLPLPEDLIVLAGGYLAYEGYAQLYIVIPIAIFGALVGDFTIYFIGRSFGEGFIRFRYLKRFLSKKNLVKIRNYFSRHGNKTIFFARFVAGFRMAVYLVAGTLKISIPRFIFVDSLGAFISVPIVVFLGYFFGEHIKLLLLVINRLKFSILFILIIFCVLYYIYKKKRPQRQTSIKTF